MKRYLTILNKNRENLSVEFGYVMSLVSLITMIYAGFSSFWGEMFVSFLALGMYALTVYLHKKVDSYRTTAGVQLITLVLQFCIVHWWNADVSADGVYLLFIGLLYCLCILGSSWTYVFAAFAWLYLIFIINQSTASISILPSFHAQDVVYLTLIFLIQTVFLIRLVYNYLNGHKEWMNQIVNELTIENR